jgi:hypothetical protein
VYHWAASRLLHQDLDKSPVVLPTYPSPDREYTSWREEGGRLPDGRHYKNYYLVDDATRFERLVITAEDSHRRDRWVP